MPRCVHEWFCRDMRSTLHISIRAFFYSLSSFGSFYFSFHLCLACIHATRARAYLSSRRERIVIHRNRNWTMNCIAIGMQNFLPINSNVLLDQWNRLCLEVTAKNSMTKREYDDRHTRCVIPYPVITRKWCFLKSRNSLYHIYVMCNELVIEKYGRNVG